ncbi:MAG: Na+:solute symporter [Gammaproteobacteria bacterium]|nr:MAG: Na+:solute symporter [Gammaproteobacteria bacterium]
MQFIDVLIILAFVAYTIGSGLYSRKVASQNLEEYFLAGRSLKGWQAGVSMAATQFAADTPLLVTGLVAMGGIFALWRLWVFALAFLLLGFVLSSSWRRVNVLTDAELAEIRYGGRPAAALRGIKAIYFGTIINCTVLALVLLAATRIAEPFLLWEQWLPGWMFDPVVRLVQAVGEPLVPTTDVDGTKYILNTTTWKLVPLADSPQVWLLSARNLISIVAIVAVTAFYSTTGGLRSVVRTDIVQFVIMLVGTALFAIIVVNAAGGLQAIPQRIYEVFAAGGPDGIRPSQILAFDPSQAKDVTTALLVVLAIQWLVHFYADGTGYLAQRTMACRTEADAKQAAIVFTVLQILVRSLLWLPLALGLLLVFLPDLSLPREVLTAERESTFVRGMAELLPPGVMGLMLTGMLAALASTVDTHLNWGSSYWANDIYKRFFCPHVLKREPSPGSLVWVARAANVFIILLALAIMTRLTSIDTAWKTSLLLGAGMGVVLVLRWLWWRITAWGEIASISASLLMAPFLLYSGFDEAVRLLIMAGGATAAGIAVSLLVGPEKTERLVDFYQRARPLGFWKPIALAAGEDAAGDARQLGRRLGATLSSAISIFFLLAGLGSWLAGSPAPTWFPWRSVWIAGLLLIGAGLIPVSWRLGFRDRPAKTETKTGSA